MVSQLSLRPSEYWARQCHVGSSFMRPAEAALRHAVGVDKIMWGSDYPHREASYPFSSEALRLSFAGIDPVEVQQMLGGERGRASTGSTWTGSARWPPRVGPDPRRDRPPLRPAEIPEATPDVPGVRRRGLTIDAPEQPTTKETAMATVRYGARSEEQLRNREVEATSVDVWATTLVATYLTDPEVIAAVLPPPHRPPGTSRW